MKKNRRRLFSDKDGTKFSEDFEALSEQIKAFITHLPLEIKKLMPIAEKAVHFIQELDDMLEDGQPVNEAIEKVLKLTKSEVDEKAYEVFKKWLTTFANQVDFTLEFENESTHRLKFETAGYIICEAEQVDPIQADTAAQLAVYAIKG
jgi:uncharacterized protein (DUF111 family)